MELPHWVTKKKKEDGVKMKQKLGITATHEGKWLHDEVTQVGAVWKKKEGNGENRWGWCSSPWVHTPFYKCPEQLISALTVA